MARPARPLVVKNRWPYVWDPERTSCTDGPCDALRPAYDERDDASAVHQHQPTYGSGEDEIALAVIEVGVPAHLLRKRQVPEQSTHDIGKYVHSRFAALVHPVRQVGSLWRVEALESRHLDAVFFCETQRRGRRLATWLERGRDGRPCHELFEIALTLDQLRHTRRQPSRGAEPLGRSRGTEPELLEACVELPCKLRRQGWQPPGRNLLATDLDQELAIHQAFS